MMVPTVHLNGTSRDELLVQLAEARGSIRRAVTALEAAAPNARDYYPQGDVALAKAQREHQSRWSRLREIDAELEQVIDGVYDQDM